MPPFAPPPSDVQSMPRNMPFPGPARPVGEHEHTNVHPPPPSWDISIAEIAVFFPDWRHIPQVAFRMIINTWEGATTACLDMLARGYLQTASFPDRCAIMRQWSNDVEAAFDLSPMAQARKQHVDDYYLPKHWQDQDLVNDLTTATWQPRGGRWVHVKLADVWKQIHRDQWPRAEDRFLVTKCLEFAASHPELDLDTTHWEWIQRTLGLEGRNRGRAYDEERGDSWSDRITYEIKRSAHPDPM